MLLIRDEQMRRLAEIARSDFERRKLAHQRAFFPAAAAMEDAALLDRLRRAQRRAKALGVVSERDVSVFADLDLCLGEGFEEREPYSRILRDPTTPSPSHRVDGAFDAALRELSREGAAR